MKIRKVLKKDVKKLMEVTETIDSNSYNWRLEKSIQKSFGNHLFKPTYLLYEDKGKIFGFIGYSQSRINYRVYELFHARVLPEKQGIGVGTKLVNMAIKEIKSKRRHKEDDIMIIQTTLKPKYFERFGFKTLTKLKKLSPNGRANLMFLVV